MASMCYQLLMQIEQKSNEEVFFKRMWFQNVPKQTIPIFQSVFTHVNPFMCASILFYYIPYKNATCRLKIKRSNSSCNKV